MNKKQSSEKNLNLETLTAEKVAQLRKIAYRVVSDFRTGDFRDGEDLLQDYFTKVLKGNKPLDHGLAYTIMKKLHIDQHRENTAQKRGEGIQPYEVMDTVLPTEEWDAADTSRFVEALIGVPVVELEPFLRLIRNPSPMAVELKKVGAKKHESLADQMFIAVYQKAMAEQGEILKQVREELKDQVGIALKTCLERAPEMAFADLFKHVYQHVEGWLKARISELRGDPELAAIRLAWAYHFRSKNPKDALILGLHVLGYTENAIVEETGFNVSSVRKARIEVEASALKDLK